MILKKGKHKVGHHETEEKIAKILSTRNLMNAFKKHSASSQDAKRPSPLWNKERKLQRETNIRRKDNRIVWQTCGLTEFQEKLKCKKQNPNQH